MIARILLLVALLLLSVLVWIFGPPLGFGSVLLRGVLIALIWVPVLAYFIWRRLRALAGARSIEKALERQAAAHAREVTPDRRPEIEVLTKEIGRALKALKSSRLGRGRSGRTALYALPWYMIVGPPAAGKSTALLASGLNFPYTPASGKGIRGVGGTRNCDWWFTNEAILLDTAGRYMTEEEDSEEWLAFLGLLKKNRPRKPLNGVLVAVAITDLLDADHDQLDAMVAKLRSRIDEVMHRLKLVVPHYLLFTKCDLLPGFVEFFSDLRKQDRGQICGATLPLDEQRSAAEAFGEEFDRLAQALQRRMLVRLGEEQPLEDRELVYQYPMQFRAARQPLAQFVEQLFQSNPYQESPLFRGFYFTSGTQEGTPIDRVMGEVARAFGIARRADASAARRSERKSYFLRDLFNQVIFPDRNLAGRGLADQQRRKRIRTMVTAAAGGVGVLLLLSGLTVAHNNSALIDDTVAISERVAAVPWEEPGRSQADFEKLDLTRKRLEDLELWAEVGPPLTNGLGMFTGNDLLPGVRALYHAELDKIMISPVSAELARQLGRIHYGSNPKPETRAADFADLKAYLMLGDPGRVDAGFLVGHLLPVWRQNLLGRQTPMAEYPLKPHLLTFAVELAARRFPPEPRDIGLAERARTELLRVQSTDFSFCGDADNVAPVELRDALRGEVVAALRSRKRVSHCYTPEGWAKYAKPRLQAGLQDPDAWVLVDATGSTEANTERDVRKTQYFEKYSSAWKDFLREVSVVQPADPRQTLTLLDTLTGDNPPYRRLLAFVVAETSIVDDSRKQQVAGVIKRVTGGDKGGEPPPLIPELDRDFKKLREFVGADAEKSPLKQYQVKLAKVRDTLRELVDSGGDPAKVEQEVQTAEVETTALLTDTLNEETRQLLRRLLLDPLAYARSSVAKGSGANLSASWKDEVYSVYHRSIHGRYPFGPGPDAKLDDVTEFLKEGGVLWGYYTSKLAKTLEKVGTTFHPQASYRKVFSGSFLQCLKSATMWKDVLFPPNAQELKFSFEVRPKSVGPQVSEVKLEIDGQLKVYRNTPEEPWRFTWPGSGKQRGVRLSLSGKGPLGAPLDKLGDWGLFRFFDAARIVKHVGGVYSAEWTMPGGTKVPLEIKPDRTNHPLGFHQDLNCPAAVR